ncbi:hypothetical protein ACG92U_08630 [Leuconostoc citreum]
MATSIQVPMPALIGKPFVHLGNAAALLSVLILGYKRGALAGGMGLALLMSHTTIFLTHLIILSKFSSLGVVLCSYFIASTTTKSHKLVN